MSKITPTDLMDTHSLPENHTPHKHFKEGIQDCIPVILGYLAIGLACGVVSRTSGMSVLETILISLLLYAGSAQFITASFIASQTALPAVVFTIFLVNIRHLLYSAALVPHVRNIPLWKTIFIGAELTDETFAVASSHLTKGRKASAPWLFGINLAAHSTWIIANGIGALLGQTIPDTTALGIDYALIALFAALLVLQLTNHTKILIAVVVAGIGGIIAIAGVTFMSTGWAIILAAVVAASCGLFIEEKKYGIKN